MWGQSWRLFRLYIYNERVICYCGNFRVFANKNIHRTKKGAFYRKAALQPVERKSYRKQGDSFLQRLWIKGNPSRKRDIDICRSFS